MPNTALKPTRLRGACFVQNSTKPIPAPLVGLVGRYDNSDMFERNLIIIILISGVLSVILWVAHSYYMEREFVSPKHLNLAPLGNEGYVANLDLEKGNAYSLVVDAIMHRNKESEFRRSVRIIINGEEVELLSADNVLGNNTKFKFDWISQAQQIMRVKIYLFDFISPATCAPCNIEIKGHSVSYLSKYKAEVHKDINHSYYALGYVAIICSLVFILAWFVALPYVVVKSFYKKV